MNRVRFMLPEVKSAPDTRPTECPHCGGGAFHRHGTGLQADTGPVHTGGHCDEIPLRRLRQDVQALPFWRGRPQSEQAAPRACWADVGPGAVASVCEPRVDRSWVRVVADEQLARRSGSGASNAIARWMNRKGGRVVVMGADETCGEGEGQQDSDRVRNGCVERPVVGD